MIRYCWFKFLQIMIPRGRVGPQLGGGGSNSYVGRYKEESLIIFSITIEPGKLKLAWKHLQVVNMKVTSFWLFSTPSPNLWIKRNLFSCKLLTRTILSILLTIFFAYELPFQLTVVKVDLNMVITYNWILWCICIL